jgi:hypothetical protein
MESRVRDAASATAVQVRRSVSPFLFLFCALLVLTEGVLRLR